MNIPKFPASQKLSLDDKEAIDSINCLYPPYSDFNFSSLYCFDTTDSLQVSLLENNLVVRFLDYTNLEPFYSFLGTNNVKKTLETLLEQCLVEGIMPQLRLLPEINFISTNTEIQDNFHVLEDRNNHDYIISVDSLVKLDFGNKLKKRRKDARRFQRRNPNHKITQLDFTDSSIRKDLFDFLELWETQKKTSEKDHLNELKAINKLIQYPDYLNLVSLGVYNK